MSAVDLKRRVKARLVADEDACTQPGAVAVLGGDAPWGYINACPGCGRVAMLDVGPGTSRPRWQATSGDLRDPTTVTLAPSVNCVGCCGWHGYLRAGEWVPC